MATGQQHGTVTQHGRAEAKWAAIVGDRLAPMPRRHIKARDILHQSGTKHECILVRDYDSPNDIGFEPDTIVDLADGNVFRTAVVCTCSREIPCDAPPKLAFIVDDRWEVTIQPQQTGETLRGLLAIPDDAEVFRDLESPHDEPIEDNAGVEFADGPVFTLKKIAINIKVNNNPVRFQKRIVTGLEIKETAIAQSVRIELGFVLYPVNADGGAGTCIDDAQEVTLKDCAEFRCVAPDDNSSQ